MGEEAPREAGLGWREQELTEALLSPNALRWHRGHSSGGTEERRPFPLTGHFLWGGTFGEGDLTQTDPPAEHPASPRAPGALGAAEPAKPNPAPSGAFPAER